MRQMNETLLYKEDWIGLRALDEVSINNTIYHTYMYLYALYTLNTLNSVNPTPRHL